MTDNIYQLEVNTEVLHMTQTFKDINEVIDVLIAYNINPAIISEHKNIEYTKTIAQPGDETVYINLTYLE